jgi:hypothetical protein
MKPKNEAIRLMKVVEAHDACCPEATSPAIMP